MLEEFNLLKIVHVFFRPGAVLLEFAGWTLAPKPARSGLPI